METRLISIVSKPIKVVVVVVFVKKNKQGSVTTEILLKLSFCGGGVVCKVIFVSNPTKVMFG